MVSEIRVHLSEAPSVSKSQRQWNGGCRGQQRKEELLLFNGCGVSVLQDERRSGDRLYNSANIRNVIEPCP